MTQADLISFALRKLGRLRAGRTASASELESGRLDLNAMLDAWNIDRLMVYQVQPVIYNFVVGKQTPYTIGASGDFNGARPTRIECANAILNPSAEAPVRHHIEILRTEADWARIRVQLVGAALPLKLWYETAFPLGILHFYPYVNAPCDFEAYIWKAFNQIAAVTEDFELPPGYFDAIGYNLAVRLAPEVGAKADTTTVALAARGLAAIRAHNAPSPTTRSDFSGSSHRGRFNWMTGEFGDSQR